MTGFIFPDTSPLEGMVIPTTQAQQCSCEKLQTYFTPKQFFQSFRKYFHDRLSYYFKSKLHPSQHEFVKSKSIVTNPIAYLNTVTPVVCSQGQIDAIYFDLSQAFNKVSHTLLLYKVNNFGFSSRYATWFQSYLSSRNSFVRILGKLSSSFSVLSGVPQGSALGPLMFNIFINDICTKIHYANSLLFASDLKLYHVMNSTEDCNVYKLTYIQ
jgi:sarcosine oxidase/L-pipecolate oxidase